MDIINKKGVVSGTIWLVVFLSLISLARALEVDLNEDSCLLQVVNRRNRRSNGDKIEITGNISFDKPPQTIPSNSLLKVEFHDARIADASSKKLGETLVNLANYKNSTPLFYNMTATKPTEHGRYSVSAVLNMGWIPAVGSSEWLRSGDYYTDTHHGFFVNITHGKNSYVKDIELVLYLHSAASIVLGNQVVLIASILAMLLMYFQL